VGFRASMDVVERNLETQPSSHYLSLHQLSYPGSLEVYELMSIRNVKQYTKYMMFTYNNYIIMWGFLEPFRFSLKNLCVWYFNSLTECIL
jgi:hypothetical protein